MTRVCLDTSVLFAATLSPTGASREIVRLALDGRLVLVVSSYVLKELRGALTRKALASLDDLEDFLDSLTYEGRSRKARGSGRSQVQRDEACAGGCGSGKGRSRLP